MLRILNNLDDHREKQARHSPAIPGVRTRRGGGTKARERVEDRRLVARARYPAPAVGLPPWYRFATNGLLLRYTAGAGGRYTD